MKIYLTAFLLLIFQTSVFIKFFTVYGLAPDFLTIFIILYTLQGEISQAIKLSIILGFFQDMLSSQILFNTVIKPVLVILTLPVKRSFYTYGFYIKSGIIILLSLLDILLKIGFTYIQTGIFYLSPKFVLYILLNFLIFGVYYVINEYKKG